MLEIEYNKDSDLVEEHSPSFRGLINIDYDKTDCTCRNYNDGYCRCRRIINTKVLGPINIDKKFTDTIKKYFNITESNVILDYCIDRLLRSYKMYDVNNYTITIDPGYYGEEVEGVAFNDFNSFRESIKKLVSMDNDSDRIKLVLLKEYSYIPDEYKKLTFSLKNVELNKIVLNGDVAMRASKDNCSIYDEYTLPLCVTREVHDIMGVVYKLIDGYHRYVAVSKNGDESKIIPVIVGR